MERYVARALAFESGEIPCITGSPKARKETPNPRTVACTRLRKSRKGIWVAVGDGLPSAGGQTMGPSIKAGIATTRVTDNALTHVVREDISSMDLADILRFPFS